MKSYNFLIEWTKSLYLGSQTIIGESSSWIRITGGQSAEVSLDNITWTRFNGQ